MSDPTAGPDTDRAQPHGIVVGVDGSDQSLCALMWAAEEAERRGVPLHLATAYTVPIFAASGLDGGYATIDDTVIRDGAEAVLDNARDKISRFDVEVTISVETGDAAGALRDLSETAQLIVVGSRGRGGFFGRMLGSVSSALPAHSKCPVAVIPLAAASRFDEAGVEPPDKDKGKGCTPEEVEQVILVGADGSDQARAAVLVAAEQAVRWGLPLRVICALPPFTGSLAWVPAPLDREALHADIELQLGTGIDWLKSHFPTLRASAVLHDGAPVEVLIEASRTARLLVLGNRGRGGFADMLLGSTSQGVLHHARGPVLVVPDHPDPRLTDRVDFGAPPQL